MITSLHENTRRKVHMREMVDRARIQRERSLKRWAFSPWHIFYESMMLLCVGNRFSGSKQHSSSNFCLVIGMLRRHGEAVISVETHS